MTQQWQFYCIVYIQKMVALCLFYSYNKTNSKFTTNLRGFFCLVEVSIAEWNNMIKK